MATTAYTHVGYFGAAAALRSAIARGDHNYRFKTTTFHADTLGCCLFLRFRANVSSRLPHEWIDAI